MSGTLPRIDAIDSRARELNLPVNVLFELTYACNLVCSHCFTVPERESDLQTAEVTRILDELSDAGALFITFTGGEIMLRPDLWEILEHARNLHFAVRLFTNGTLIDEAAADRIAAIHPVDVGVSIYGANARSHELVTRQPGSFDASVRALRLLHERGVATRLKCVLSRDNVDERADIARLAEELGADPQFDPQITPRNDGDRAPLARALDEQELADLVYAEKKDVEISDSTAMCSAGRDALSISPTGKVSPCVQMPLPMGDLRRQSFSAIWNGAMAEDVRALTVTAMKKCPTCPDIGYCNPCLGLNLVEMGDPTVPSSSVCRMARARRRGAEV